MPEARIRAAGTPVFVVNGPDECGARVLLAADARSGRWRRGTSQGIAHPTELNSGYSVPPEVGFAVDGRALRSVRGDCRSAARGRVGARPNVAAAAGGNQVPRANVTVFEECVMAGWPRTVSRAVSLAVALLWEAGRAAAESHLGPFQGQGAPRENHRRASYCLYEMTVIIPASPW